MKRSSRVPAIAAIVATVVLTIISTNHVAQAQQKLYVTGTYAAKFICGVQSDITITNMPDAQAGRYSTKLNVHNSTGGLITFRKKIIVLRGGEEETKPKVKLVEHLLGDEAMEVVCQDIYKLLDPANLKPRYMEGFVIFEVFYNPAREKPPSRDPLDVEGIYTYKGDLPGVANASGVSINVVVFPVKNNAHILY